MRQARHWGWGLRVLGEDQMAPCRVPIWASGTKAHAHVKKAVGVGPGEEEKARGSPSCVRLGSSGRPPPGVPPSSPAQAGASRVASTLLFRSPAPVMQAWDSTTLCECAHFLQAGGEGLSTPALRKRPQAIWESLASAASPVTAPPKMAPSPGNLVSRMAFWKEEVRCSPLGPCVPLTPRLGELDRGLP